MGQGEWGRAVAEQVEELAGWKVGKFVELIRRKDMATVKVSKRQSKWQLKWAQAKRNLAWAWERVTWMALGAVLGLFAAWLWR